VYRLIIVLLVLLSGCATSIGPECRAKWPIAPIGASHHVAAAIELDVLDAELACERERRVKACRAPHVVIEPGAPLQAITRAELLVDQLVRACEAKERAR